ncbi:MAG: cytochrome c [Rhodobacteraceae bacterium]|nr:cytochrome c [Paracoccaceae bacterium]
MLRFLRAFLIAGLIASPSMAGKFNLGRAALPTEVAAWNIDVRPDGQGLPAGSGSVIQGEALFAEQCADCHGDFGEAVGRWPALAGGNDTLADERPVKTIGSYWPYLSTAWDYINRAMPYGDAQSLSADEVYQLVAYILYLNDEVDEDFVLSQENFADFTMPNAGSFRLDDRDQAEYPAFGLVACMTDCKASVQVIKRAIKDSSTTAASQ